MMIKDAVISDCGKYRYRLWRIWDESKPAVLWVMHNPSTADANQDDPTIRRCIGFARDWGYGGIYVGNIYPYRATNPKDLKTVNGFVLSDPHNNVEHIKAMSQLCALHILAHGNPINWEAIPIWLTRAAIIIGASWHYLKLTKAGNPCHPLYLPKDLKPIKFEIVFKPQKQKS